MCYSCFFQLQTLTLLVQAGQVDADTWPSSRTLVENFSRLRLRKTAVNPGWTGDVAAHDVSVSNASITASADAFILPVQRKHRVAKSAYRKEVVYEFSYVPPPRPCILEYQENARTPSVHSAL